MGVSIESWCFCKGVGKSEKMKAAVFSGKGPAMARICCSSNGGSGTGFFIHRNLLLTSHVNIPSVTAAETSEIRLQNGVAATLVPHRRGARMKPRPGAQGGSLLNKASPRTY